MRVELIFFGTGKAQRDGRQLGRGKFRNSL